MNNPTTERVTQPNIILVVEDDEGLADLFQNALEGLSIPLKWLRTGGETLTYIPEHPACLLLLDYSLPDMNATQLVSSLAESGKVPPFIVITGHGGERVAVDVMKLGALDYLIKDTQILDRLPQTVERILKDFRMRDEMDALERRSQENARELAAVYEHSPMAFLVLGEDLRIKSANPAALRVMARQDTLTDLAVGDVLKCFQSIDDPQGCGFSPSCSDCPLRKTLADTLEQNRAFAEVEFELIQSKKGRLEKSHFLISSAPLQTRGRPGVLVCLEDITQRKLSEVALKASEERFRRAILEAPIPMIIFDERGVVLQISRGWTQCSGYAREDIPNLNLWLEQAIGVTGAAAQQRMADLLSVAETTPPEVWEIKARDGRLRTWDVQTTSLGRTLSNSRLLLIMAVDMTDRLLAEAQLLRSQRMESVGRLASGIAHDLNNVLAPILMALPMLREAAADEQVKAMADAAENSANRGAAIIRQLLTFGRGLESQQGPVQLKHLVREMGQIIRETFPKSIRLEMRIASNLWMILGDVTQLHQVLLNLCINARDAMPGGGILTLSVDNLQLLAPRPGVISRLEPGPCVRLTVLDTGIGIAPKDLDNIFEPFFTTKDISKGTGLGLATVLGIVKSHNGIINVSSESGQGSVFEVLFPALPESTAVIEPAARKPMIFKGKGEAILVVDDETGICKIARQVLEQHGYQVHCASDGQEALEIYSRNAASIRLVITDFMMPRMDGLALAVELRRILPRIPLVLSSGLGENIDEARETDLQAAQFDRRLAKPYSADVLLATVDQLLYGSR